MDNIKDTTIYINSITYLSSIGCNEIILAGSSSWYNAVLYQLKYYIFAYNGNVLGVAFLLLDGPTVPWSLIKCVVEFVTDLTFPP